METLFYFLPLWRTMMVESKIFKMSEVLCLSKISHFIIMQWKINILETIAEERKKKDFQNQNYRSIRHRLRSWFTVKRNEYVLLKRNHNPMNWYCGALCREKSQRLLNRFPLSREIKFWETSQSKDHSQLENFIMSSFTKVGRVQCVIARYAQSLPLFWAICELRFSAHFRYEWQRY